MCGFEFGYDDNPGTADPMSFAEYRADWESGGSRYSGQATSREPTQSE